MGRSGFGRSLRYRYYIQSIKSDIEDALERIIYNPVNYVLNLSRVLYYLRDSVISSKKEAGEWALNFVPAEYKDVIAQCLATYNNNKVEKHSELYPRPFR